MKKPAPKHRRDSTTQTKKATDVGKSSRAKLRELLDEADRTDALARQEIADEADRLRREELSQIEAEDRKRIEEAGFTFVENDDGLLEMTVVELTPEVQEALNRKVYGEPGVPETGNWLPGLSVPRYARNDSGKLMQPSPANDPEIRYPITLIRDHVEDYPELWLSVYLAGPPHETRRFIDMFSRARCRAAESPEMADLVVFAGGDDISPELYGEKVENRHMQTHFNRQRDVDDVKLFLKCLEEGIPMFGVCRGLQFLHAANGGRVYQHVDGHHGDHSIWDIQSKRTIDKVSSVHHQMCIFDPKIEGVELLATGHSSTSRWKNAAIHQTGKSADVEALFYRDTCSFGVQGHPEYQGYPVFTKWCLDGINEFVGLNPDIDWKPIKGKIQRRRMKQEVIDNRGFQVRPELQEFLEKFD